jgi:hypothetical protein
MPCKCAPRLCDAVQAVWAGIAELRWPQVACVILLGFPLQAEELATGACKGPEGLGVVNMTCWVAAAAAVRYATPASVGFVQDRLGPP